MQRTAPEREAHPVPLPAPSGGGWFLILRDAAAFAALADRVDRDRLAASRVFVESNDNIVFLELTRA
ncbi:hypothetical protein [Luedemannella helvata]|uniref:Uncharacterized protein n=1 Tax=Luedemannella helvata TaxID=349315 RepID=A0ABN2JU12_9ACTN